MNSNQVFVTIEGIHGAGKTTCVAYLEKRLREYGRSVVVTNDQSGSTLGRELRGFHLTHYASLPDSWTEALLIAAASRQNLVETVLPALARNAVVIQERFGDAFLAFQGYGRHLDMSFLRLLRERIEEGIRPDITILLDLPATIGLGRLPSDTLHRIEREPVSFHESVRKGYLEVAAEDPDRIVVIDSTQPQELVYAYAWEYIRSLVI